VWWTYSVEFYIACVSYLSYVIFANISWYQSSILIDIRAQQFLVILVRGLRGLVLELTNFLYCWIIMVVRYSRMKCACVWGGEMVLTQERDIQELVIEDMHRHIA
jgi:hypothetical protein